MCTYICGPKFRSSLLLPWKIVSGWDVDFNHHLNYTVLVCSDTPIPVYFTFANYSSKDLIQLRTLKKNILSPPKKIPQMKYKKKGSLTRKRSLLPKGTARRITHSFGMLKFPCTPYNLHGIASSTTVLYICRSRMKTRPTASHLTPRPHVLTPTCSQAHSHGLCGTAEAFTSLSFHLNKEMTDPRVPCIYLSTDHKPNLLRSCDRSH